MVSRLELIAVGPTHYEVTVVTITSGIAVCKSEFGISDIGCFEEELVENREESNRMRFRAYTCIIITSCRVRHVTLVIGSVEVFAIPAGGEEYLSSDSVTAVGRKPIESATCSEAHERYRSVGLVAVVVCASERIPSNHPKSIRKR